MNRLALLLLLAAAPMLPAQQLVATDALPSAPSFLQAAQTPAQSASLTGTVTDTAGALVPGAAIVLEAQGQPARHTTTDTAGRFTLTGLPPATWHAVVAAIGLESQTTPPFILQPGERLELPTIALAIANATESVLVSGNSVEVAEAELNLETQQRTLGIIPNFRTSYIWNAAPLDAHQKYKLAYRTLSDPFSLFPRTSRLTTTPIRSGAATPPATASASAPALATRSSVAASTPRSSPRSSTRTPATSTWAQPSPSASA
jgi:hypothetical protein